MWIKLIAQTRRMQDHRKQVELLEAEMMELKQQLEQVLGCKQGAHEDRVCGLTPSARWLMSGDAGNAKRDKSG